eukprot:TRINITY_DN52082_c0_g1_i1.p2 TRINITY_DN52082_c0_g1~~TRINITY_DN52082_c0_g1_i1.p2  ORF type:complete len:330 (+),score=56.60 TRINITY_DN52082_c0_g1_i1:92-1081(+)
MPTVHFAESVPPTRGKAQPLRSRGSGRAWWTVRSNYSERTLPPPDPAAESAAFATRARDQWAHDARELCPMHPSWHGRSKRRRQRPAGGPLRRCPAALRDRQRWAARFGFAGGVQAWITAETKPRPSAAAEAATESSRYVEQVRSWLGGAERAGDPHPDSGRPPWPESHVTFLESDLHKRGVPPSRGGPFSAQCRRRASDLQGWVERGEKWLADAPNPPAPSGRRLCAVRALSSLPKAPRLDEGRAQAPGELPAEQAEELQAVRRLWDAAAVGAPQLPSSSRGAEPGSQAAAVPRPRPQSSGLKRPSLAPAQPRPRPASASAGRPQRSI